ncbi:FAD-dependent oxidoreductase [Paenibacillus sp. S3N08]|uniref:FAD-dependent oxidoreductase n=1 Tax=Paenibacillus agricola TaxID=2716264 RepID=A0ABX0JBR5_9BACL|nr:FAD-dependent oxidoreductase [Paenibacillus agricola]
MYKDLIIIGAGPAGLSAAAVAAAQGLQVAIIDEFPEPGGRMLGQFHQEPGKGMWVGKQIAEQLIGTVRSLGGTICCGISVYGLLKLDDKWEVSTSKGCMISRFVLLATGAAEAPVLIPGWTLPGVLSIGAVQVLTNVHYVKPGHRGMIIGMNMLAMAITSELAASGVSLSCMVLPASPLAGKAGNPVANLTALMTLSHLAPTSWMRWGGQLAGRLRLSGHAVALLPRRGIKAWGIPLLLRTAAVSINGRNEVESVTLVDLDRHGKPIAGSQREEKVDFVALAGGLYPLAELASVAGCPFVDIEELGGHVPLHNERLQTPVDGLYVAGNITGVESAQVAMAQGQLAAISICSACGLVGSEADDQLTAAIHHVNHVRSTSLIQFHPGIQQARNKLYRMMEGGEQLE